jgi:hypothetical protein
LCSAVVPADHRHLLDLSARRIVCACRACSTLFDGSAAGGRSYRLIPERVTRLAIDGARADAFWVEVAIPVDLAFFFLDSAANRIIALYPGPMGATESQLPLAAWDALVHADVSLARLQPDVEALLVNRTRGNREHLVAPIDACYGLAGVIRTHWKGLGGGEVVWAELERFLATLRGKAEEEHFA